MIISTDFTTAFLPADIRPELTFAGTGVFFPESNSRFLLSDRWAVHLYRYAAGFRLENARFSLTPGTVSITPPGIRSSYTFTGRSEHFCFHFKFTGRPARQLKIPTILDMSDALPEITALFQEGIRLFSTDRLHAEIKVWDLLMSLAERSASGNDGSAHAAYRRAVALIESAMHEDIDAADIAGRAGVSVSHLNRLFKKHGGTSPAAYLRARRMTIARYWLEKSDLSVKEIAFRVGIRDLQAFNKLARKYFGRSPRSLRGS